MTPVRFVAENSASAEVSGTSLLATMHVREVQWTRLADRVGKGAATRAAGSQPAPCTIYHAAGPAPLNNIITVVNVPNNIINAVVACSNRLDQASTPKRHTSSASTASAAARKTRRASLPTLQPTT